MADREVLDGRNRLAACERLGIEATFVQFEGDDPVAFVLSENLHRRHLNESQRAMVAARIATMREGRPAKKTPQMCGVSAAGAASKLNVGTRSVEHARSVIEKAAPEVVKAVESGKLAVSAAAELAKLEPEEHEPRICARCGRPRHCRRCAPRVVVHWPADWPMDDRVSCHCARGHARAPALESTGFRT